MVTSGYSKSSTYEPSSCKLSKMQTCVHNMSGAHCYMRASSTSCAFVYFIEYNSTISLFQAQDVRSRYKSNGDVVGIAKKHQLFTVLLYFSRYCTVRLEMFSLLCIICVKSTINLLQYIQFYFSAVWPIVLVGYLG